MNLKNMITRLTSNYNKNESSNVYKLFSIISSEIESLKAVFDKIESWRSIRNAEGTTLDLIGEDIMQDRQGMSDEQYRPMLRFKSSLNKSATDINSVNTTLKSITDNAFIRIHEGYNYRDINEPASIMIELKEYNPNIQYEMIDTILAAGVRAYARAISQTQGTIYMASATLYGETTTVYPYKIERIEAKAKVYVASGYNTSYETVKILPK
ncbi:MAG: hypothetical protein ACTTHM_04700 [Peptoanaerobacter stomatis]|uniref:hypothetical protein n=1 Tax=Peptoanaerobacter stomatis TaxID=796937 RepID=UPI003F9ECC69